MNEKKRNVNKSIVIYLWSVLSAKITILSDIYSKNIFQTLKNEQENLNFDYQISHFAATDLFRVSHSKITKVFANNIFIYLPLEKIKSND